MYNPFLGSGGSGGTSESVRYAIEKIENGNPNYATQYRLKQTINGNITYSGTIINIPKDMFVESGDLKTCETADVPVEGYAVGDKYLDLVLANSNSDHIYILVADLIELTASNIEYDNESSELLSINVQDAIDELNNTKVTVIEGKGLSTNDYSTLEKNKLAGIEGGAQVNVQSDWNQTDNTRDDFIKNKPDIFDSGIVVDIGEYNSSPKTYTTEEANAIYQAITAILNDSLKPKCLVYGHLTYNGYNEATLDDYYLCDVFIDTTEDLTTGRTILLTFVCNDRNEVTKIGRVEISNPDIATLNCTGIFNLSTLQTGVQSDWNQTDNTEEDFIKNKPPIYTKNEVDNLLDDKAGKSIKIPFTLTANNWSGNSNTITLTGVTENSVVDLSVAPNITSTELNALLSAKLVGTSQASNTITLTAFGNVPLINIPLIAIVGEEV